MGFFEGEINDCVEIWKCIPIIFEYHDIVNDCRLFMLALFFFTCYEYKTEKIAIYKVNTFLSILDPVEPQITNGKIIKKLNRELITLTESFRIAKHIHNFISKVI